MDAQRLIIPIVQAGRLLAWHYFTAFAKVRGSTGMSAVHHLWLSVAQRRCLIEHCLWLALGLAAMLCSDSMPYDSLFGYLGLPLQVAWVHSGMGMAVLVGFLIVFLLAGSVALNTLARRWSYRA